MEDPDTSRFEEPELTDFDSCRKPDFKELDQQN